MVPPDSYQSVACFVSQEWRLVLTLWLWFCLWVLFKCGEERNGGSFNHSAENITLYSPHSKYLNQNTGLSYRLLLKVGRSITTKEIRNKTLSSKWREGNIKGVNSRNLFFLLEYQAVIWHGKLSHYPFYPRLSSVSKAVLLQGTSGE